MGYKLETDEKFILDVYDEAIGMYEHGDKVYLSDREYVDDLKIREKIMQEHLGNIINDRESVDDEVQRLFANYKRMNKVPTQE